MTNIPTDLLRTLIAVVDLRSYTKAAAFLGITQPAVSAQIKRLQFLLGTDLFDRRVQGVSLTSHGQAVVSQARRLLSINDQILALGSRGSDSKSELLIRIGTPSDFIASYLPDTLARFRARWPDVRFSVRTQPYDPLVRQLHSGEIDVMVAQTMAPPHDARHFFEQEVVWVRSPSMRVDLSDPVPLVSGGDSSIYRRLAVQMLREAGLHWEDVFTSPSMYSLSNAVAAGLGVMPISRRRARWACQCGTTRPYRPCRHSSAASMCVRAARARAMSSSPTRSRTCCSDRAADNCSMRSFARTSRRPEASVLAEP
ncbi:LysR family transcriptional regulator [Microbacteriaceae bacterium K1510]|nr:LysR family transcriptional regulator [Microbacteriaceae bacterium K1510]